MKRTVSTFIIVIMSLGVAIAQTPAKKTTAPATKTAVKKTTTAAPAKTPAKKTTTTKKTTAAKKTAEKPAAAPAAEVKQPAPTPAATPAADTSSSLGLKDYAKSKVDEAKATKDTLVQSGADRVTKMKEKLGEKIKNFDPFKAKADTTKK